MLIARSPVRISFGGGGTDLPAYYEQFGGAVLSTSINKYFYTILRKRSDGRIQVISADLRATETWRDIARMSAEGTDLEIPLAALKYFDRDISVDLFLASEIPPGTGLGSSASVCVNVLKIVSSYLHLSMSNHQLAEAAFHIARSMLQKPVGRQDEFAAAFGGLNYVRFLKDGTTVVDRLQLDPLVHRELQGNLMLFYTGASHRSWSILQDQEQTVKARAEVVVEALHETRDVADRMRVALTHGELYRFGVLLHQAWEAKRRISSKISTSRIDALYELARNHGAVGGKITGAGGGGFLLLYCERPNQESVRNALAAEGIREMAFEFDTYGTQVIVNDPFLDEDEGGGTRWIFVPSAA